MYEAEARHKGVVEDWKSVTWCGERFYCDSLFPLQSFIEDMAEVFTELEYRIVEVEL